MTVIPQLELELRGLSSSSAYVFDRSQGQFSSQRYNHTTTDMCNCLGDIAFTNVLKWVRCMGQILFTVLPNGMDKLNMSSNEPSKGNIRIQILSKLSLIPCIHIFISVTYSWKLDYGTSTQWSIYRQI